MTFTQFLSVLRARWFSAAVVFVLTVATAVAVSLVLPKQYSAVSAVVVDVRSPDPIQGLVLNSTMTPSYIATQVDIIQSDRVAQRVARDLKLMQDPTLRQQWQAEAESRGDLTVWIAEQLQKKLDVRPSRESNVINVSYQSTDPKFSATLANAFVQAYMDTNVELRVDPARQYSSLFDQRGKQVRGELEKAQKKLSAYQQEKGIVGTVEQVDIETARLNELSTQLVAMQAISAETNSRQNQAGKSLDQLSDVINNPLIASLKADLTRQETQLQQLNARLGEAHPQVIEAKASITELRSRLRSEMGKVGQSVGLNANINRSREAEVRAMLAEQRERVLKLKGQRDELSVLQRDVENAQRAYDAIAARLAQTSIESQTQLTNVSVLSPATEPTRHSSPRLKLNTALAVFAGALLALATVLLRELVDRRVRSPEQLTQLLDQPVIGVMLRPHSSLLSPQPPNLLQRRLWGQLPRPSR